ncbi:MAG: methylated-DNA--[protein]-cysteine S-methyltransferase [Christensenellaceae bacterium]|nr:methylated-DNA--[protein]-cysteine S-methyltransferase [Christensenellaceae bacterium]
MDSPVGHLRVDEEDGSITGVNRVQEPLSPPDTPLLREAVRQLRAYFDGVLTTFDLPLKTCGTTFQERCWAALREIPYGTTVTYGEQARRIGSPKASRAVGGANHHNPISIIIPCHRVVGANGSLTGYGGGLDMKEWLLNHERSILKSRNSNESGLHANQCRRLG